MQTGLCACILLAIDASAQKEKERKKGEREKRLFPHNYYRHSLCTQYVLESMPESVCICLTHCCCMLTSECVCVCVCVLWLTLYVSVCASFFPSAAKAV